MKKSFCFVFLTLSLSSIMAHATVTAVEHPHSGHSSYLQSVRASFKHLKSTTKPVTDALDTMGISNALQDQVKNVVGDVLGDTSLYSVVNAAEFGEGYNDASKDVEKLMDKALQRGLGGRFLGFKEAQPLPSIGALGLPFLIGKGVQAGISAIPFGGTVADSIGKGAGRLVQFVLRKKLTFEESHCDALTLTAIQLLSEEVSAGFVKTYKSMIHKMSDQERQDFVFYASISILDHMDQLLKNAKDGDLFTANTLLEGMTRRYLKIDYIAPTTDTIKRKVKKIVKRKHGVGAETVGDMMTTPVVRQGSQLYIDQSPLQRERAENMKKRGHLKAKRSVSPKGFIRDMRDDEIPNSFKATTPQEIQTLIEEAGEKTVKARVTKPFKNKAKRQKIA